VNGFGINIFLVVLNNLEVVLRELLVGLDVDLGKV